MTALQYQIDTLKQRIVKAFADVPYPKGKIADYDDKQGREINAAFNNQKWKTIEPRILEKNYDNIPLFSSAAFNYFLPAYLIYSLDNFSDKYNTTVEFTIYAVTPGKKDVRESLDYYQKKFEDFTLMRISS